MCACEGVHAFVVFMLLYNPHRPSDWVEMYPLHRCVCQGDLEGMRHCFRMGAEVDAKDTDSWTPLHYACWYRNSYLPLLHFPLAMMPRLLTFLHYSYLLSGMVSWMQ